MARATMRLSNDMWVTDVYNSDGQYVKTIPTHPSQVRPERKSCLWKKEKPQRVKSIKEYLTEKMNKATNVNRMVKYADLIDEFEKEKTK